MSSGRQAVREFIQKFIKKSAEIIEGSINILKSLKLSKKRRSLFFGGLAFLVGCTGITDGIAEYKIVHVESKISEFLLVSAVPQNVSVNQNGAKTVTLPYESRKGAFPVACELESLVQITEAAPCVCDKKVCEVEIRPPADVHGEGSFAFRLVDAAQAHTGLGIVKVKILPVRVSADSGSGQEGRVGTIRPLVALVQNSNKVPVSGVKVSWRILDEVSGKDGKLEEPGKGVPCKGVVSDDQGKARCDWTLGTRVGVDRVSDIRRVEASIFDSAKEALKPALAQFTATIKSGPATKLAFSNEYPKSPMAAGKMGPIGIYPQDAYGNLAETPRSFEVTLTSMKGPKPNEVGTSGASEAFGTSITATLPPKGGLILKDLFIKKVGVYFLEASSPDLPGSTAEGPDFRVVPDKADRLVFVQQPGQQPERQPGQQPGQPPPSGRGIAGAIWAQQPKIRVQDTYGNEIPGFSSTVTIAALRIGGSSGANTLENPLKGTLTIPGIDGVATFTNLKINKVGQYRLEASSSLEVSPPSTLLRGESAPIDIDPAAASKLVFVKPQPSGGEAGLSWKPSPQVAVEDFFGNRITSGAPVSVMIVIRTSTGNNPIQLPGGATTVKTVNGVADFTGLSFKQAGEYKLTAISSGLFWDTSDLFKITPGPMKGLAFIQSPGDGTVGEALAPSPQVVVKDDFGNTVTTPTIHVDLGIDSSNEKPLGGTKVQTADGVATFPGLSINKAGIYKLKASSEVLPGVTATSSEFKLNPKKGVGEKLVFTTQPVDGTADNDLSPQPEVTVQDAYGNPVTSSSASITLAIGSGTGTLLGTVTRDASSGVATFSGLSIRKVGTYTLTASSSGLTGDISSSFTITTGVANKLSFTTKPGGGTGGIAWDPQRQPVVTIQDAGGNTVTSSSATVTLAIENNPSVGKLGVLSKDGSSTPPITKSATNGVATFSGLSIDKIGEGYTLKATSGNLTADISSGFNITLGEAAKLAFTTQPGGGTGGTAWNQQPKVTIQDAGGNTVTSSSATVTLTIKNNPSSGVLSKNGSPTPPITAQAANGVATFSGLSIDKIGNGYTLEASSGVLTVGISSPFNITLGEAAKLAFTPSPGGGTGGMPWSPQPKVTIQDAGGNPVTSSSATVTLVIENNPSVDKLGVLSKDGSSTAPITAQAVNGVATFSGLSIDKIGTGYTLKATASGLANATAISSPFNITLGGAAKLAFTTPPGGGTGGTAWNPQPKVTIQDAGGNTVTSSSATVTLTIENNPSGVGKLAKDGSSTPPITAQAVNGMATFSGLSIDKIGTGYTLKATASGLANATAISSPFNITLGAAAQLAFTTQPGGGDVGSTWDQQPVVAIQDAGGNTVSSSATVTLIIKNNPSVGKLGVLLKDGSSTAPITAQASGGVATFSGLSINKSGIGYSLEASGGGFTKGSNDFNITIGTTKKLVFTKQPSGGTGGTAWSQQPEVTIQDADGITVSSSATVTLTIKNNPSVGKLGVLLKNGSPTPPITAQAANGVATFSGLSIDKIGNGYTLEASSGVLTVGISSGFNITLGEAAKLAFTTSPDGGTGGMPWNQQPKVTIQDAGGNTVTSSSATVTLAIENNPSGVGKLAKDGSSTAPITAQAANGVATFSGLSIDKVGTGYTLRATSGNLIAGISSPFNITLGEAAQLAFTTQPGGGTAGIAWGPQKQPVVTIQDAGGNTVSSSATVTLAIENNPSINQSGVLSKGSSVAPITQPTTNGVAIFSGLSINKSGIGYTLKASGGGFIKNSKEFNITAKPATKLVFTTPPPLTAVAGAVWGQGPQGQPPELTAQDDLDNADTAFTSDVTLTLNANSWNGVLLGGATVVPAVKGVARFPGLFMEKAGTGYTLTATSSGFTVTSSNFEITHGPASKLEFATQPGGAVIGEAFTTQPAVTIRDAYGNKVTTGADGGATLTMSLATGTGNLSGIKGVVATQGFSSWTNLSIDALGDKVLQVDKPDLKGFQGGTGPLTALSKSFIVAANPPPVPTGLGARAGDRSVVLSWTASSGATGYNILRGINATSLTPLTPPSNSNSYEDTAVSNGVIYFYAVQAFSLAGTSDNSSKIQARPLSKPLLNAPTVNDTAGTKALYLSWSASTGGSNYQVKYSTTSGSASSGTPGCTVTALKCTITGLTSGTTYYFSVNATNTYPGSVGSVHSSESSGIPRTAPTLSLIPGSGQITPTFESAGATSFELYYGTQANPTTPIGAVSGTAVKGLVNGTTYYFRVVANFPNGRLSSEASAAPIGPGPFTITSATPRDARVVLEWSSSAGATSYTVKYGTSSGSYATFATGFTGTSTTVTGLTNGITYYFMVTAVNADGSLDADREKAATPTKAAAAWSTKLVGYAESAMLVRHGAKGALAKVAFDSAGRVSASSTVTITSAGTSAGSSGGQTGWQSGQTMPFSTFYSNNATVYVNTWYDQSGNHNDATQSVKEKQPVIVTAGVLETGIVFIPANQNHFYISYAPSLDLHSGYTIDVALAQTAPASPSAAIFSQKYSGAGLINIALTAWGGGYEIYLGVYPYTGWPLVGGKELKHNQPSIVRGGYDGNEISLIVDGTEPQSPVAVGELQISEVGYYIGRRWDYDDYYPMKLSEIILRRKGLDY